MKAGGSSRAKLVALESHLLDRVQAAVLVTDFEGQIVYANSYCEVLYGRSADEIVGQNGLTWATDPIRPEVMSEIGEAILNGRNWEGEFRVTREDGTTVDVHAVDSPVFDDNGEVSGVISLAVDVTAQRLSHDELRRVLAVAQILRDIGETLVAELDAAQVMKTVTGAARKLTGASVAAFLTLDPEEADDVLFVRATSGRLREPSLGIAVPTDAALLAAALSATTPIRVDDAGTIEEYPHTLDTIMPGLDPPLRSAVVTAVRTRAGEVAGAMIVAHPEANRFSANEEHLLRDIAGQAGIVLDIAQLFRAAEVEIEARRRAEEVQRFYAETSAVLSLSLDYPESFEQLARLCVPFLADLCLIDVAEEHGIRRLAAVHADPGKEALVSELETEYTPDPYGRHPAASVVRGGPPEVAGDMSDDFLRTTTRDERHLQIVKDLEFIVVYVRAAPGARSRARRAHPRVVRIGKAVRRHRPRTRGRVRAGAPRSPSTTRVSTPNATMSRGRCSRACSHRHCPTSRARP